MEKGKAAAIGLLSKEVLVSKSGNIKKNAFGDLNEDTKAGIIGRLNGSVGIQDIFSEFIENNSLGCVDEDM